MRKLIAACLIVASMVVPEIPAFGYSNLGTNYSRMGAVGSQTAVIVLTNLRITNTGAFRTTNTTANRAVFP